MPKKKTITQDALDILEQAFTSIKKGFSKFLTATSRDKRTKSSTKREWQRLTEGRTNKEVGEQLGIPYQRVTAIKKKVLSGEAYSPELRDLAKREADVYTEEPRQLEGGVTLFPNRDKLENSVNHVDLIKTFPDLEDARRYWKKIIQSDQYIAIVNEGNGFYSVVGMGRRSQRPKGSKGEISDKRAKNRMDQILKKYPRSRK